MERLLDPDFRLPRENGVGQDKDAIRSLKRLQGKGVKVFKAKD